MLTPTCDQGSAGLVGSLNRTPREPRRVSIRSAVALWTDLQVDLSWMWVEAGVLDKDYICELYNPTLISPVMHWTKVLTLGLYGPRSARSTPSRRIPKGKESFLIPRFSLKTNHFRLFLGKIGILVVVNILPAITISRELLSAIDRTPEETVTSLTRTPQPDLSPSGNSQAAPQPLLPTAPPRPRKRLEPCSLEELQT